MSPLSIGRCRLPLALAIGIACVGGLRAHAGSEGQPRYVDALQVMERGSIKHGLFVLEGRKEPRGKHDFAVRFSPKREAVLSYNLDGHFTRFETEVGIDARAKPNKSARFQVIGVKEDGNEEVLEARSMSSGERAFAISVSVKGFSKLRLQASSSVDGLAGYYAIWGEPRLSR